MARKVKKNKRGRGRGMRFFATMGKTCGACIRGFCLWFCNPNCRGCCCECDETNELVSKNSLNSELPYKINDEEENAENMRDETKNEPFTTDNPEVGGIEDVEVGEKEEVEVDEKDEKKEEEEEYVKEEEKEEEEKEVEKEVEINVDVFGNNDKSHIEAGEANEPEPQNTTQDKIYDWLPTWSWFTNLFNTSEHMQNEPLTTDNPEVGEIEEEYVDAEDWEKEQVEKYEDGQEENKEEIVDDGNMKEPTKEPITQPSSSVQTNSEQ